MNRIQKKFIQLQQQNRKVLSPYITAGDPHPQFTVALLHTLVEGGADVLELGIPFSDPMAEGPVIQAAMERALANHVNLAKVLQMVAEFRKNDSDTPIVLMGYLNPIENMGYAHFAKQASSVGVDGVIIVDLPSEEAKNLVDELRKYDIDIIFLISPTTSQERLKRICAMASGYLYYVSLKGVTGAATLDIKDVANQLQQRKPYINLPVVVGFGVKTPANAADVARLADGVAVGAALVEKIASLQKQPNEMYKEAGKLIHLMRVAIDNG